MREVRAAPTRLKQLDTHSLDHLNMRTHPIPINEAKPAPAILASDRAGHRQKDTIGDLLNPRQIDGIETFADFGLGSHLWSKTTNNGDRRGTTVRQFKPSASTRAFVSAMFTALAVTATLRDDGDVWLDLADGLQVRASFTKRGRAEPEHVSGKFPATVWHGLVEFARTPTGLWLVTLPEGDPFTMVVWPEHVPDRGAEKVCAGCHVSRPVGRFTRNARNPDGLQRQCGDCSRVAKPPIGNASRRRSPVSGARRRVTPAALALANAITPSLKGWKTCSICVKSKPAKRPFFVTDHRTKDKLQHLCAECSETVPALMRLMGVKPLG